MEAGSISRDAQALAVNALREPGIAIGFTGVWTCAEDPAWRRLGRPPLSVSVDASSATSGAYAIVAGDLVTGWFHP